MNGRIVLALVFAAACGSEHGSSLVDAPTDGKVPPPPPDAFDPCTPNGLQFLTGELVDFDSSQAAFEGVFAAKLSIVGDSMILLSTPPNGRLDVCVPPGDPMRLDLDAPPDFLDGSIVITRGARRGLRPLTLRAIRSARATSFYTQQGLTFDPTKAHVLVFHAGDVAEVTLDRPHGTAQGGNEDPLGGLVWTGAPSGRYILFPNVDVATPTGTITGDPDGPLSIPLVANELTIAAVSIIFI